MSTTVTYRGSTLTTVENATKKLTTAGTWLEDDITIQDVSSGGGGSVVVVDTPDSHGGTIREITATNAVMLQGQKQVTMTQNPQTFSKSTGYDGFESIIVTDPNMREDLTVPKDVDFIDYDGRLVYSYTAQEFLALTAMPNNPINEGLVAQGWNWTLSDAKAYVAEWGCLVVGQSYTTDDGRTRVYFSMPQELIDIEAPLYLQLYATEASAGTIYWGDGTSTSISTASANAKYITHVYSTSGNYVAEVEVTSGSYSLGYQGSNRSAFDESGHSGADVPRSYTDINIQKVEIGNGITSFGRQPFKNCNNLKSVSLPITLTGFREPTASSDGGVFMSTVMRGVVFPSGFQGKSATMFTDMQQMRYISVPKSTTLFSTNGSGVNLRKLTVYAINNGATSTVKLNYCKRLTHLVLPGNYITLASVTCEGSLLRKFTIPATVTTIQTEALMYSNFLTEIHVLPTSVPTLNNVRAFNGLSSHCVIYVPYSADHSILEAYKTATNWSSFASYMQEEPQS